MGECTSLTKQLNARFEEKGCYIAGLAVVSRDLLVLSDRENNAVKLIDVNENKLKAYLQLCSDPRGIAVFKEDKVAVAVSGKKLIQIISINKDSDTYTMS